MFQVVLFMKLSRSLERVNFIAAELFNAGHNDIFPEILSIVASQADTQNLGLVTQHFLPRELLSRASGIGIARPTERYTTKLFNEPNLFI